MKTSKDKQMNKIFYKFFVLLVFLAILSSCKNNTPTIPLEVNSYNETANDNNEVVYNADGYDENGYDVDGYDVDGRDENGHRKDDTYTATVEYYNPSTGYYKTYTLNVEVENGEVTVIYFPNGGYLDSSSIYPSELDEDGYAEIEGEEGKIYKVQIDF